MIDQMVNITPYMQKGIGVLFGTCEKPKPKKCTWVHKTNPFADYVQPFENGSGSFDFVRFWHFIMSSELGIMFILRRAIQMLKTGGFLLICEATERVEGNPQYFNYGEMEGILMLFDDFIHIDAKGINADGKTYFFVCRKQGKVELKQEGVDAVKVS